MQVQVTLTEAQYQLLQQVLTVQETHLANLVTAQRHMAAVLPLVREMRHEIDFAFITAARRVSQARQEPEPSYGMAPAHEVALSNSKRCK